MQPEYVVKKKKCFLDTVNSPKKKKIKMFFKILWIFYFLIYSLIIICLLSVSLSFFIKSIRIHLYFYHIMNVQINSESNIITVKPTQNTRVMTNFDEVDFKFEFNLPNEEIQAINDLLGADVTNNIITGTNPDYIINTYIIPIIQSNNIDPLIHDMFIKFIS